jgi:hypothetical protein
MPEVEAEETRVQCWARMLRNSLTALLLLLPLLLHLHLSAKEVEWSTHQQAFDVYDMDLLGNCVTRQSAGRLLRPPDNHCNPKLVRSVCSSVNGKGVIWLTQDYGSS